MRESTYSYESQNTRGFLHGSVSRVGHVLQFIRRMNQLVLGGIPVFLAR